MRVVMHGFVASVKGMMEAQVAVFVAGAEKGLGQLSEVPILDGQPHMVPAGLPNQIMLGRKGAKLTSEGSSGRSRIFFEHHKLIAVHIGYANAQACLARRKIKIVGAQLSDIEGFVAQVE
jgi:hypothetical protein